MAKTISLIYAHCLSYVVRSLSRLNDWWKARPKCEEGADEREEGLRHGEGMAEMKGGKNSGKLLFSFFDMKYFKVLPLSKRNQQEKLLFNTLIC